MMLRGSSLVLSGLCVVLGIAAAYEMLAPLPAYSVPTVHIAGPAELPAAPAPFVAPPEGAFAAITERPLFDALRTKYVPRPTPEQQKAAPPPPPTLLLVGVIIDAERRMAMVKSSEAMLATSVGIGAEIGGWEVSAIEPDRIVLKAGTAEDEIRLDANKAPSQPAQQQPPQPVQHQTGQQQSTP